MSSIDIGSNTVRLLLADVKACRVIPVRYEQSITSLARGLSASRRLGKKAMEETLEVLQSYKDIAEGVGILQVSVAGTGALREAENTPMFVQMILEQTGLNVEVIHGHVEADLTAMGVTRSLSGAEETLILDIGGASTELAAVREGQVRYRHTIPKGVVKLLEEYVDTNPPTQRELNALKKASRAISADFVQNVLNHITIVKETIFISTSGTPTSLAAMDLGLKEYDHARVHGHRMNIKSLEKMLEMLAVLPTGERARMGCLDPKRADLIIPGLILTIGIMKSFGFHEMTVSDQGLLEGLLLRAAGCCH